MNKFLLVIVCCLAVLADAKANQYKPYSMPETQVVPIRDTHSDRNYELYIKLPESYYKESGKDKQYPVIYFTDAVWHIEILSAATAYLMEDVILVGISWQLDIDPVFKQEEGAHASRYRDYSMVESTRPEFQKKYNFGQANKHLEFIRKDVFKYVESNYRVQTENRTYFSYSLGGQLGVYTLLTQPQTFKNYVLGSPAMRNKTRFLSQLLNKSEKANSQLNANVFISYGDQEEELGKHAELFIELLKAKNDKSLNLTQKQVKGTHQSAFPTTSIESIKWLVELNNNKKR